MLNQPQNSGLDILKADIKFSDFIGQEKLMTDLKNRISFAKSNKKNLPHIMLSASPEMGKVTLAKAVADEIGVKAVSLSSQKIKLVGDLASVLTNLSPGDILVVEDISGFNKSIDNLLYQAIESGLIDIVIGKGSSARTVQLELPPFTVITTTSKPWQIDEKIRRWFVVYDFAPYTKENVRDIFIKLAKKQGFEIDKEAAGALVGFCNGSPGNIAVFVKRISHYINDISSDMKIGLQHIPKILGHLGYGESYPQSLSTADKFSHMSGLDFERWTADHFRHEGYKVEMTKATGDHGIDLLLYKENNLVAAVQCKCWDGSIGEPVVRDFYGALMSSKAPKGYIYATTTFTQQAVDFIQDKQIELVDLEKLITISKI